MEGKYALLREIGRGAMGEVFLAEDRVLERKVALKFLTLPQGLDKAERQEAVARFYREAQAAAKLAHPNIVVIYDIDELEGRHFISMEYLEGETLDEVMARGPLPPERATEIVSQILSALSYAHSQGVIHRDIKPENIFLSAAGTVKVTDFGIARVMGSSTMTQAGTVMGTPGYMSPEQVKGEKVDARTDIFSAGVILYELLTGSRAFAADSLTAVMYRIVNEDPPPLMQVDPSLPAWLQRVVARATAKDPGLRYPDASAMISDLAARGEAPLPSPSPSSPPTVMLAQEEVKEEAPGTVLRPPTAPLPVPEGMSLSPAPSRRKAYLIAVVSSLAALLVVGGAVLALLLLTSSRVTVPDLEGLDIEEAKETAEAEGLEVSVEYEESETFAENMVILQKPKPGKKAEKGDIIALTVSKGAPEKKEEDTTGNAAVSDDVKKTEAGMNAPFWTVIVASLDHRTGHTQAEAEAMAAQARSRGLHAGVLDSTKFLSLRQPYWVVYCGIFKDQAGAEAYLSTVKAAGYGSAYVRYVDFYGPGEIGPIVP